MKATTNLNAQKLEERYGNRVCSRMRQLFNLIDFNKNSIDNESIFFDFKTLLVVLYFFTRDVIL